MKLLLVRQWIHVWCCLVYFYGRLHLAVECSTLSDGCSIQHVPWFDSESIFMSVYGGLWDFTQREGGPRIPRSILPCSGGCRTNFAHFHCEGGHAPGVDFGYIFMRQSTNFPMKVDSDPDGELPDDWQSLFLPQFAAFFRTPSAWT